MKDETSYRKFALAGTIGSEQKAKADLGFANGNKLSAHIFNIFVPLSEARRFGTANLQPLEHYGDFFRKNYPQEADYTLQQSDSSAVVAFDQLVDEFNADLERMRQEEDSETAQQFLLKALELKRQKK